MFALLTTGYLCEVGEKQKIIVNALEFQTLFFFYSKTCLKWPLKKKTKNWFSRPIMA